MAQTVPRYNEAVRELVGRRRFGAKLDLGRVEDALVALGRPQNKIPHIIQVGGTNGKGSTCRFIESLLGSASIQTGLFTSPHLIDFSERFRVSGIECSRKSIAEAFARVRAVDHHDILTFFEYCTLMAVLLFADAGVAVAIFEVGLGGRGDATTAIGNDIAVVTGVALDHENVLGNTLKEIAFEKAAIFHDGGAGVIGCSGRKEGRTWLQRFAKDRGAEQVVSVEKPYPCSEKPAYQASNAAAAIAAVGLLRNRGVALPLANVEDVLRNTAIPGRWEWFKNILLDCAHNYQGVEALAKSLAAESRPVTLLGGMSGARNPADVFSPIIKKADNVIWTQAKGDRAQTAASLQQKTGVGIAYGDTKSAMAKAVELAGDVGIVVATGSLQIIGEVRAQLLGRNADAVSDPPLA